MEKAVGHDDNAIIQQDVSSYEQTGEAGETMKALAWMGKNKVEMSTLFHFINDHSIVLLN